MKARPLPLLLVYLAATIALQAEPPAPVGAPGSSPVTLRTTEQLDQLLGPIALYPDALVALILPASTAASDIVLASRFLAANGSPESIAPLGWDESVKALAHYPELVKWMDDNLEWTMELGQAFVGQPAEVMQTVQRLRARARAAGTLVDTPQQHIVMEGDNICIVPAEPTVIYVPRYDPEIVYVRSNTYYAEPYVTFGVGFAIGSWLSYDCDWGRRVVWVGRRPHDWRPPVVYVRPRYESDSNWRCWKPSPRVSVTHRTYATQRPDVPRPRLYADKSPRPDGKHHEQVAEHYGRDRRTAPPGAPGRAENTTRPPRERTPGQRPEAYGKPPEANRPVNLPASPATPAPVMQRPRAPDGGRADSGRIPSDRRGGEGRREGGVNMTPTTPPQVPATRPAPREREQIVRPEPSVSPRINEPRTVTPRHEPPAASQPPPTQTPREPKSDPRQREQDKIEI